MTSEDAVENTVQNLGVRLSREFIGGGLRGESPLQDTSRTRLAPLLRVSVGTGQKDTRIVLRPPTTGPSSQSFPKGSPPLLSGSGYSRVLHCRFPEFWFQDWTWGTEGGWSQPREGELVVDSGLPRGSGGRRGSNRYPQSRGFQRRVQEGVWRTGRKVW